MFTTISCGDRCTAHDTKRTTGLQESTSVANAFCALKRMYLPITDSLPVENKGKIIQWIEEISERIYVILFREKLVNITYEGKLQTRSRVIEIMIIQQEDVLNIYQ